MPKSPEQVPTYDFYKRLNTPLSIEYSRLEKAYNTYDASHAHRHDYFEILLFEKSGGIHEIDFVEYPVKKDSIHILSPGQVHLLRRKKDVTGHVIAFKEEALLSTPFAGKELQMPSPATIPVVSFKGDSKKRINNTLNNLLEEFNEQHVYSGYSLSARLMLFLIEVIRHFENNSTAKTQQGNPLFHNFTRLVDKHFVSNHSVSDYAKMLHVTPGHLNDTVKKDSGKSASEIIHERMILESRRLLYHSNSSIKEISAKLNYEDPSYFVRFFKKRTGTTPAEFRSSIRERYS